MVDRATTPRTTGTMMTNVFRKYLPNRPSTHASTRFSGWNEENSSNGFPVATRGSLTAVESTRSIGRRHGAAQKPRNAYFAGDVARRRNLNVATRSAGIERAVIAAHARGTGAG